MSPKPSGAPCTVKKGDWIVRTLLCGLRYCLKITRVVSFGDQIVFSADDLGDLSSNIYDKTLYFFKDDFEKHLKAGVYSLISAFAVGDVFEFTDAEGPNTGEITSVSSDGYYGDVLLITWKEGSKKQGQEYFFDHELARAVASGKAKKVPKGCAHSWQKYVGFTDVFDYCGACGIKKP